MHTSPARQRRPFVVTASAVTASADSSALAEGAATRANFGLRPNSTVLSVNVGPDPFRAPNPSPTAAVEKTITLPTEKVTAENAEAVLEAKGM